MPQPITADTASTDLGTQGTVVSKVGGHTTTTTTTLKDGGVDDHKKRKRHDDMGDSPDGERGQPAIQNRSDLHTAIQAYGKAKDKAAAKRHISKRARALGLSSMLPDGWHVEQEREQPGFLTLEFDPAKAVLQEATSENKGVMRLEVPFYKGDSVAKAPGFDLPLFFPKATLSAIVQEGMQQIGGGQQPLTVFARHAHALTSTELPIGKVVELENRGGDGYAVLEIAPTEPHGRNVQTLVKSGMLNAVSLRSGLDYELERAKVNGELVLEAKRLPLAGIDFAPEGPAQATYGIKVLQEVKVEPDDEGSDLDLDLTPEEEEANVDITLEKVRSEAPAVLQAIEQPLRDAAVKVEKERDSWKDRAEKAEARNVTLEAEVAKSGIAAFVSEVASKFPKPDEARAVLAEKVKDAKSVTEAQVAIAPILLETLAAVGSASTATPPPAVTQEKTTSVVLAEMFGKPVGRVTQSGETLSDDKGKVRVEFAGGLPVPA